MKPLRAIAATWLVLACARSAPAASSLDADLEAFDRKTTAELRSKDPDAASLYEQANAARATKHQARAVELYRRVHERAPDFVHATRRLCSCLVQLGQRDEGLTFCRQALTRDDSPENHVALAEALLAVPQGSTPTPRDLDEAKGHALSAFEGAPKDYFAAATLFRVGAALRDATLAERAVLRMEAIAPEETATSYFRFLLSLATGRLDEARAALEKARAGMPEHNYRTLSDELDQARPWTARFAKPVLSIVGIWIGGLVILTLAGWALSRATLRAAAEMPPTVEGSARGRSIRGVYRWVVAACCVYYYLSLPLVLVAVIAAGAELVYGFFLLGHVPLKLVVIAVIVVAVTVISAIKSLFVRGRDEDPGTRLDVGRHPRLRAVLDEVAHKIGTRPVTNVYMTPGTEIAVLERGGMTRRFAGQTERCLILGAGALDGLRLPAFQAILAHEYGHFSNRDTAGGGLALAVRRSILTMGMQMARGGAATWYNPAWWFLKGFYRLFLFVSQGASRLQEILADRWAAFAYGSKAFEEGLRHVIERAVRFDRHVDATLSEVVGGRKVLPNLYAHRPAKMDDEATVAEAVREALERMPSAYDSHPSPMDRFRWVRALDAPEQPASAGEVPDAWSLFSDREEVERAMTAVVRENIRASQGVELGG